MIFKSRAINLRQIFFAAFFYFSISLCHANSDLEPLTQASKNYINFIHGYGTHKTFNEGKIDTLFSQHIKKILNGIIFFETRESFLKNLSLVRNWTGGWEIKNIRIIVSTASRDSVIYYLCSTQEGDYVTVSILNFDTDYLISEINTVYNKLEINDPNNYRWYSDMK